MVKFCSNIFSDIPAIGDRSIKEIIEEHQKFLKKPGEGAELDFQKQVVQLILDKLITKDWDRNDYVTIKNILLAFTNIDLKICKTSLLKCLAASNEEIMESLQMISEEFDFYPEVDRVYSEVTKTYDIQPKEIKITDSYLLLSRFVGRMNSFTAKEKDRLVEQIDDFESFQGSLSEIIADGKKEEQDVLLKKFDETFSCLQKYSLYRDIYEEYRKIYLSRLATGISKAKALREYEIGEKTYFEYVGKRVNYRKQKACKRAASNSIKRH